MATKQIILVTGGNGGIGLELIGQLLADASKQILLGSRSVEKGEAAVKELQAKRLPGTVELLQVDVNDEQSIEAAAKTVESRHGRLDALVNNAAVARVPGSMGSMMAQAFQTNATGPYLMVEYFAPLLRKAAGGVPRIVNVSSNQGSIGLRYDVNKHGHHVKGMHYRASKSALNMITACQTVEFGKEGFKIFAYCPGFTVSNLGPFNNPDNGAKPTSEGAAPIVSLLNGERDAETGMFVYEDGQYPW